MAHAYRGSGRSAGFRVGHTAHHPQRGYAIPHSRSNRRKVSIVGLGGSHIGKQKDEQESIRIIRSAIDRGITFMDNSWDYNEGKSEERMGKALREGYRDRVFLMTKFDGRTEAEAAKQIDESLKRLQTDRVDLMHFHEVIRMEDADRIFGEKGLLQRCWLHKRRAKCATSGSPATKTRPCICACSKSRKRMASASIRC